MLLAAMQLAAENAHRVTASRMKRVEDLHLKSQTPGIMALARAGPARLGSHARSVTRPAAIIAPSSIIVFRGCSKLLRSPAVTGRYARLLKALSRVEPLILDDWGLEPLTSEQRRDLLEVIDDPHQRGSTIITSQVPIDHWHEVIADPSIADAVLDRLIHNAHRLELKGDSMRKITAQRAKLDAAKKT
jgi:hypothetical protein